ncbi:hypothetical protein ETD86_29365 [Nonomuraea turkmeniaca]|uniref:Secreted protein n=1 Tax=Nonomuraea turkmeniaca TaxID=103838 RepID=A0A5S4FA74_9ACTN|nr:hypothetical protein [Nonomuraea turkmeniaca]TMR14138.1 hypothetical protein ETD86_29365 [Nonomuraea turkmeniaca]
MTSMTMTWVAVAVVAVVMLAIASIVLRQRRQRLRRRFGPEYERTLSQRDTRGEAERELRTREKRFATLDIKPLSPQARQSYRARWTKLQAQFVDAPGSTVGEADQLVMAAMAERGYPAGDFQQQLSNLSVVHGRTLHHYRKARQISGRAARDQASTEDLRQAMVHYRVLFEELLDDGDLADSDTDQPQPAAAARDDHPALHGDLRES